MNLKSSNNVATNQYALELEVSPEELDKAVAEVYKKESRRMSIPGFRKGRAPRAFIEKMYGEDVFFQAAVDHLYTPMMNTATTRELRWRTRSISASISSAVGSTGERLTSMPL